MLFTLLYVNEASYTNVPKVITEQTKSACMTAVKSILLTY